MLNPRYPVKSIEPSPASRVEKYLDDRALEEHLLKHAAGQPIQEPTVVVKAEPIRPVRRAMQSYARWLMRKQAEETALVVEIEHSESVS